MNAQPLEAKARKPRNTKASKPQAANRRPTTVHLAVETLRRLDVHAMMASMDRSSFLEQLVEQHCRRFVISDRGQSDGQGIGAESAA